MKDRQSGFTLIEYVISSAITMVVLGATFTLLNIVFAANGTMGEVMTTQQNVRVAMNTIARDIVMAGTGVPAAGIPVPNGTNSDLLTRPGIGGNLTTPTLAILTPGDGAGPVIAGVPTDVITIVTVDQESPAWNALSIDAPGTEITFPANQDVRVPGTMQMFVDDLLLVTNVNGSVFVCVTTVGTGDNEIEVYDNDTLNVNQPTAQFGNLVSLQNPDTTYPPTTLTRVNIISYYLDYSVPAHPKLMRSVNAQAPQVAVEDIDNLQFSYDLFDLNAMVQTANQPTTAFPNQIRSVHIAVNGRSPQVLDTSKDYYRFGLVSKVNVRNATFRNRYTGT